MVTQLSKKFFFTLPLLLVMILIGLFWYKLGDDPRLIPSALLNKPVPSFTARTLDHTLIDQKLFDDHVSVLTVWATWCLTCHSEHPFLMDIKAKNQVQLVGINYKDSRSAALVWLSEYGNPFKRCIYDPEGALSMQFGVYGTPETFLIDKGGVIRYKHIGALDAKIWREQFEPRIKGLMS